MFQTKLNLHFYDCDPAGIIFYANLFKLAHIAFEEFLNSISPERNLFYDNEIILPVIHSEADYKKPLKAFDRPVCKVVVKDLRDSSFQIQYIFSINDEVYAEASTVHVCVDKKSFQKTNLPEYLKQKLSEELG